MLVFLLSFCCFLYNGTKVIADSFYIFDVGQGNCQLAIFEEEGIGILYDCGSSCGKKPIKFIPIIKEENWIQIYQKKTENREIPTHRVSEENLNSIDEESKDSESKENSKSDGNSTENEDSPSMSTSFFDDNVKPSIVRHLSSLSHLFIILSHPEKDHINLINANTIPDEIPITVLCEGDWFSQKTKNRDILTADVCNVLLFLKQRDKTHIVFPFYSKGVQCISKTITYTEIWEQFWDDDENFSETFKLCQQGNIKPSLCLESLDNIVEDGVDLGVDKTILKNIKILHINFPFKDANSQSAIVEIKMPKLGMRFFLTGDASNETLAYIVDNDFFRKEENYISLVMLPHHGSSKDKSVYIFNLFQPDIIGISAGNGGQFSHPSKELIDEIQDNYKNSAFFSKFDFIGQENNFLYFDSNHDVHLYKQSEKQNKIPFICTNILGNIRINETGFSSCFSSSVQCGERVFQVNYRKSIIPIDPQEIESTSIFKAKLEKNKKEKDIYCYLLKGKYYQAEEVNNENV